MTTGLNHGYGGVNVNKKLNVNGFCTDLAYDLVGSVLYAAGIVCFVNPANMAPGGMSGVAILLNYLWGLPIGTMTIVLNIPLLILSYIFLGKSLTWKTVKSLVISSLMVDLVMARYAPIYAGDRMIGGVFGGVLMGGKVQQRVGDAQIVGGQVFLKDGERPFAKRCGLFTFSPLRAEPSEVLQPTRHMDVIRPAQFFKKAQ